MGEGWEREGLVSEGGGNGGAPTLSCVDPLSIAGMIDYSGTSE